MRRIIICLDGTWASPGNQVERGDGTEVHKPSNVLKTYRAVLPLSEDGIDQISYYDEGVGALSAQRGLRNKALAKLDSVLGGAWGAGFEQNIEAAYTFIAGNKLADDEIFVFGFNRGAGQARSLCRFIDWMGGMLHKRDAYFIPDFFKHYIETEAADGAARELRQKLIASGKKIEPPVATKIRFLGVYDTVLALGSRLRADFDREERTTAPGLSFHVGDRPPGIVNVARQALAIDERRTDFRPEIWQDTHPDQSVEQRWFPGVHTSIGGGYANDGLANGALQWMINDAKQEGLAVDDRYLHFYRPWFGDTRNDSFTGFMKLRGWIKGLIGESGDRDLVAMRDHAGIDVHDSAIKLLIHDNTYRPDNLLAFIHQRPDLLAKLPAGII
ncbi:MAG: DUF2235 domain-containing protein [Candidatus Thiodiazotropha sp. (ex Codakia orbicularis)]|nr:DUF2235 domain-containing protein [Candidatus Thiodiazotropha sp. (ex Codakia orbicularis)]